MPVSDIVYQSAETNLLPDISPLVCWQLRCRRHYVLYVCGGVEGGHLASQINAAQTVSTIADKLLRTVRASVYQEEHWL